MQKNELSAWTLLLCAAALGSIVTVSLGGCKPPASRNVDVSTGEYVPTVESNATADNSNVTTFSSNVTTGSSNVTGYSPSAAVETPVPITPASTRAPKSSSTVGVEEFVTPEAVLSSGGDWPQWGGTCMDIQ